MIHSKYLSTAFITAALFSAAAFASDDDINPDKRSGSSDEIEWVEVKKERTPELEGMVLPRRQALVPSIKDLRDVVSHKKGKNRLNPSGSKTNCLDCSIAFFNYINTGNEEPAADNPSNKPNVLLASQGVSLIDGDLAENLYSMKDRPDVIVLEGDKSYQFIDVDGRAQILFKACGMLIGGPNLEQHDNPIKQEPLLTLEQTLDAIPLTNGRAVGCVYLEFLPQLKEKLEVDNGFTGHFQNFYIFINSDGKKEIWMVDAQDGDIITLKKFLLKNRMKSDPTQTMVYKNRMYVWWDRNAASEGALKVESLEMDEGEDILAARHFSEESPSEERDPETGKRSRSSSPDEFEDEGTRKQATLPPKDKEELDEPVEQAVAHAPTAPLLLVELRQIANWQRQIIGLKRGHTSLEDRVTLAEYDYQMSIRTQDSEEKKHHRMLAVEGVMRLVEQNCYNSRIRTLITSIWGHGEQPEGLPVIYTPLSQMVKAVEFKPHDPAAQLNAILMCLQACEFAPEDDLEFCLKKLNSQSRLLGGRYKDVAVLLDGSALQTITKHLTRARLKYVNDLHRMDNPFEIRLHAVGEIWACLNERLNTGPETDEVLKLKFEYSAIEKDKIKTFKQLLARLKNKAKSASVETLRDIHTLFSSAHGYGFVRLKRTEKFLREAAKQLIDLAQVRMQALAEDATAQDHFDLAEAYFWYSEAERHRQPTILQDSLKAFARFRELIGTGKMPKRFHFMEIQFRDINYWFRDGAPAAMQPVAVPAPAAAPAAMQPVPAVLEPASALSRFTLNLLSSNEIAKPAVSGLQFVLPSVQTIQPAALPATQAPQEPQMVPVASAPVVATVKTEAPNAHQLNNLSPVISKAEREGQ